MYGIQEFDIIMVEGGIVNAKTPGCPDIGGP